MYSVKTADCCAVLLPCGLPFVIVEITREVHDLHKTETSLEKKRRKRERKKLFMIYQQPTWWTKNFSRIFNSGSHGRKWKRSGIPRLLVYQRLTEILEVFNISITSAHHHRLEKAINTSQASVNVYNINGAVSQNALIFLVQVLFLYRIWIDRSDVGTGFRRQISRAALQLSCVQDFYFRPTETLSQLSIIWNCTYLYLVNIHVVYSGMTSNRKAFFRLSLSQ